MRTPRSANLRPRPRRRGAATLELLFVLPVLLALLFATVEISMILTVRQQLEVASREGARAAAQGGDATEAEAAARLTLGGGRLAAAEVEAFVTGDDGQPVPPGGAVVVVTRVRVGAVVPDLLAFAGVSLRNQTLAARAAFRRE